MNTQTSSSSFATVSPSNTDAISSVFGPNADLYVGVLGISPTATTREIRTAYFKRCRESLFEHTGTGTGGNHKCSTDSHHHPLSTSSNGGINTNNNNTNYNNNNDNGSSSTTTMSITSLSNRTKLKFQAVSYAYEILSNPETKHKYDTLGIIPQQDPYSSSLPQQQQPHSTIPLSVWGVGIAKKQRQRRNSVHWNEEVHELLIIDHDDGYIFKEDEVLYNRDDHVAAQGSCCGWFFCEA